MYIKVRAAPGSKKEEITEDDSVTFRVSVKEMAERNLANKRIAQILALHFGVSSGAVRLISGHHSRNKIFSILDQRK